MKNQMKRNTHEVQKGPAHRSFCSHGFGTCHPCSTWMCSPTPKLSEPHTYGIVMEVSSGVCLCVHMLSHFSHVGLFATPQNVARRSPSLGFSRQDNWSGLPCPPPGYLPDPGNIPASLLSLLHYQEGILPLVPPEKLPFREDGTLKIAGYSKSSKTDKNLGNS